MEIKKLYRPMYEDNDSKLPLVGCDTNELGIRCSLLPTSGNVFDIECDDLNSRDADIAETPNGQGISTFLPDPNDTVHDRFKKNVNKGLQVLWGIKTSSLAEFGLKYELKEGSNTSALIVPLANGCSISDFQKKIASTVKSWENCNYEII